MDPLPPEKLKDMLETSMSSNYAEWYGDANIYNEVLVNSTYFWEHLPKSIAAFVYFDDADALMASPGLDMRLPDTIVATTNYVKLLNHYNLSEADLPLLRINRTGEVTIDDVSLGARKFIANHTYERYRKQHPYRKVVKVENGSTVVDGGDGAEVPGDFFGQQGLQEQAANAGRNERVVSGDLVTCRRLNSEQIIWGDRPCSRRPLPERRRHRRAAPSPSPMPSPSI